MMSQCINMACIGRETHGIGNSWDVTPPHIRLHKDICQLKMGVRFWIIWVWTLVCRIIVLPSYRNCCMIHIIRRMQPPFTKPWSIALDFVAGIWTALIRKVNDKPEKPTAVHQQDNATAYDAQFSRVIIWKHLHRVRVQSVHHVPSNKENH